MSARDLKSLTDRPVPDDQLEAVLPLIKCEIDSWEGDELKIEVTPDRPDLLSVEGIARQLSYWLGFRRGLHEFKTSDPWITLKTGEVRVRPKIVAGCVRGLSMNDEMVRSVMQLQEAIDYTIGRDRVKTAIGIHDVSRVKPPFYYKEVGPKDAEFVPLGMSRKMSIGEILKQHPKGRQYSHIFRGRKRYPIIVDRNGDVLSFPPIINGELTKVRPETKDIFIDITGFDLTPLNSALNILLAALEARGGRIESVMVDSQHYPHIKGRPVSLDRDMVKRTLGIGLKDSEISDCLERMGYRPDLKRGSVIVPPYRADIIHPVDVIEDIAIAYGFNDFVPEVPRLPTMGRPSPEEDFSIKLKHAMVGLGFQEMVNLSLSSTKKQFSMMGVRNPGAIELENPVSSEYDVCRHWLLPSLLENLAANNHRRYPQRIFEVSDCVRRDRKADTGASNQRMLSAAVSHAGAGFSEILSLFRALAGVIPVELSAGDGRHGSFIEGRCADILLDVKPIGVLGEIHPRVLKAFGLKMPVAAMELDAERIWEKL